jgi:hypothetical protein
MPNTIEWSEEEMQLLIDLRRNRNNDYSLVEIKTFDFKTFRQTFG